MPPKGSEVVFRLLRKRFDRIVVSFYMSPCLPGTLIIQSMVPFSIWMNNQVPYSFTQKSVVTHQLIHSGYLQF
jgi:hypothetical protein